VDKRSGGGPRSRASTRGEASKAAKSRKGRIRFMAVLWLGTGRQRQQKIREEGGSEVSKICGSAGRLCSGGRGVNEEVLRRQGTPGLPSGFRE